MSVEVGDDGVPRSLGESLREMNNWDDMSARQFHCLSYLFREPHGRGFHFGGGYDRRGRRFGEAHKRGGRLSCLTGDNASPLSGWYCYHRSVSAVVTSPRSSLQPVDPQGFPTLSTATLTWPGITAEEGGADLRKSSK